MKTIQALFSDVCRNELICFPEYHYDDITAAKLVTVFLES
jgi:hypothetical protein